MASDSRLDQHAQDVFERMGYVEIPDALVDLYNKVKERKDRFQPGKMSADVFALMAVMVEGTDTVSSEEAATEEPSSIETGDRVSLHFNGDEVKGTVYSVLKGNGSGYLYVSIDNDANKYRRIPISDIIGIL